jgi:hypothetical protein
MLMKRVMNVTPFFHKRYGFVLIGLGFVLVIWVGIINYWTVTSAMLSFDDY